MMNFGNVFGTAVVVPLYKGQMLYKGHLPIHKDTRSTISLQTFLPFTKDKLMALLRNQIAHDRIFLTVTIEINS